MKLNRRAFSSCLAGSGLATLGVGAAAQQAGWPVEGVNYVRLAQPLPPSGQGKVDVVDFFWYECPHCNAFEPALDAWARKLPADVNFRRVPVWFREEPFTAQQKLYYALESLGLVDTMHRKVFAAIHNDRTKLRTSEEIQTFMAKNGVDATKFMAAYNSFAVQTKSRQARQIAEGYKIDAVPALGVHGRYFINGTMAGGNDKMLQVADALIAQVRRG
ncbi:thiol:disulfide interchange protein DsbA/DsbL [Piscinibacter koreensis]|uniref:Thiol:disulfide interchange protein n=1 Tax=Piscinibacter koreensis TaxID=2742824 RepID=A0A7Y6NK27_9BURK|nr:thiol:disulfide interchange protein DsbA/DsbL [Schlegelella koreensis]NUZ04554.1 thiol:disulfide interchange protein DsbA/DsbL [Schlegelella koreensis]